MTARTSRHSLLDYDTKLYKVDAKYEVVSYFSVFIDGESYRSGLSEKHAREWVGYYSRQGLKSYYKLVKKLVPKGKRRK